MNLKKVNWSYLLKHWFGTLLLGPILGQINEILTNRSNQIVEFLEYYIFYLLFGLFYSSPTYMLYGILYCILSNRNINNLCSKSILTSFAIVGIIVSFLTLNGISSLPGILCYSLATLFFGFYLKLNFEKNDHNTLNHKNKCT